VDATGWTQIGLIDLRWNEFLNYRIEPNFFSTDLGVIVNLEKWNSLSEEAQEILQDVAIAHEADSVEACALSATRISPRWRKAACRSFRSKAKPAPATSPPPAKRPGSGCAG
jgi:hypothetical protein